jgi:hypothetical protein
VYSTHTRWKRTPFVNVDRGDDEDKPDEKGQESRDMEEFERKDFAPEPGGLPPMPTADR